MVFCLKSLSRKSSSFIKINASLVLDSVPFDHLPGITHYAPLAILEIIVPFLSKEFSTRSYGMHEVRRPCHADEFKNT